MKKGRKILNRILSLVLCLVMASGMFAGLGMEAKAAEQVVHDVDNKKGTAGEQVLIYVAKPGEGTDGITTDTPFYSGTINLYPEDSGYDYKTLSNGDTYQYDKISRIEVSDDYDFGRIWIPGESGNHWIILLIPNGTLNVTVKEDGNALSGQKVEVEGFGSKRTDSAGRATFKVRNIWASTVVKTTKDGYTYRKTISDSFGTGTREVEINITSPKDFTVILQDEKGKPIKGANITASAFNAEGTKIAMNDSDNNGTYVGKLRDGVVYSLIFNDSLKGFSVNDAYPNISTGEIYIQTPFTPDENIRQYTVTATLNAPSVFPANINMTVGDTENIWVSSSTDTKNGVSYSWRVEDDLIVELKGEGTGTQKVTALKSGTTNIIYSASHGTNVKSVTIPVTVNKKDPVLSVTVPGFSYGKCDGYIIVKSDTAGTFTIGENTVSVTAGTDIVIEANTLIGASVVGEHSINYTFVPKDETVYNRKSGTASYTVAAGDLSNATVSYEGANNLVYDGNAKTLKNIGVKVDGKDLTENTDYRVAYSDNINAGTGTMTITGMGNYTGVITRTFEIAKAKLSVANVTADNRTYDGTKLVQISGVELNNIATGDKLSDIIDFAGATAMIFDKDAGEYASVNNLSGISLKDTKNYEFTIPATEVALKKSVIISPAKVKIVDVIIDSTKTYDGNTTVNITDKGIVSGVIAGDAVVVVEGTARYEDKNVGDEKLVTFSDFSIMGGLETVISNYELAEQPSSQTASITKKSLRMAEGSANVKDKLYDGTTAAEFSETPTLVQDDLIENDKVTIDASTAPVFNEIGSADKERPVKVTTNLKITGADAGNYSLQIPEVAAMIKNYTAARGKDYSVNSNEWNNEDFVITAGDGCLISEGSLLESVWTDKLVVNCEDNNSNVGTKAFYVKNANGEISRVVNDENAEYKIDKIAPTGTVTFTDAQTPWTEFIETISFGLFYKDAQEVVITSQDQDGLSGVASVEWYESLNKGMTLEEVEAITNWKEYKGNLIVALEDTKKFVYYVKITDNAGNVTYLSTDGAVYDITNPAITGVVNGETYYTSQMVNVSDVNLEAVTFNGETLTITDGKVNPIELEGNIDKTYTIVATDKAGNTTEVTVTMKTISSLSDQLADITEENVTSDDAESIDEIQKIIADENQSNATEEEIELLKELLEKCGNLEKTLEAAKEVVNDAKEVVNKVTEGNVTLNEVTELKKAKDNLESILSKNKGNLTAKEKEEIQKTIADLDAIIEVIDEVKAAAKAIKAAKSADGEYGVPDNEAAVSAYERAKDAYDRLTEEQKAMLGSDVKKALKEAKAAITNYKIIEGDGKIWVHNTNGTITFVGNGLVRKLKNVIIDGKVFSAENYHVSKGSTVVEVEAAALYRLGLGDHTFQMEYEDGKTDVVEFSIVTMEEWNAMSNQQTGSNKTGGVATGDSANILLWGTALAVGAAGLVVANKKRKDKKA